MKTKRRNFHDMFRLSALEYETCREMFVLFIFIWLFKSFSLSQLYNKNIPLYLTFDESLH